MEFDIYFYSEAGKRWVGLCDTELEAVNFCKANSNPKWSIFKGFRVYRGEIVVFNTNWGR